MEGKVERGKTASIPTSSHCCGYQNLRRHRPHKLCVLHLSSPREVSRGARKSNGSQSAAAATKSRIGGQTRLRRSRVRASIESA